MTREIVLDTETTGLNPLGGDRVVEIGCVELVNHIPSGRHFHRYINPERRMPEEAFRVHGLSDAFLSDKPKYAAVAAEFAEFVGDATLIIHNAAFDIGFLNAEHSRVKLPKLANEVIDTVEVARRVHPGARAQPLTRSASTTASIIRSVPCTARCSTARFWPTSYLELTSWRAASA